jgi:hypothetical protein
MAESHDRQRGVDPRRRRKDARISSLKFQGAIVSPKGIFVQAQLSPRERDDIKAHS